MLCTYSFCDVVCKYKSPERVHKMCTTCLQTKIFVEVAIAPALGKTIWTYHIRYKLKLWFQLYNREEERCGSVVESLTHDRGVTGWSLTGGTAF